MGEGPDDPSPPIPPEPGQSGSRGLPLSLSVRRALFGRLLDSEHMLGVLRRALPALTGARIDVEKCKTRFVRSEEASREGKVHLLFKTRIKEAGLAARKFVLLGVAPVASGYLGPELDERSRALRDHPWVKPFCRLSSYVEDLRLALLFFPLRFYRGWPRSPERKENGCSLPSCPTAEPGRRSSGSTASSSTTNPSSARC